MSLLEAATDDDLVVEIKQGKLRGRRFESIWNKTTYYGFLGIPYAKPPVNNLRFQVSTTFPTICFGSKFELRST